MPNNMTYYESMRKAFKSGDSFLHYYEQDTAFTGDYYGDYYHEPWVSYTREADRVNYNKTRYEKLLNTPLTLEIIGSGKVILTNLYFESGESLSYKKNDGEWTSVDYGWKTEIDVAAGDVVQFLGNRDAWATGEGGNDSLFSNSTCQFNASGNIMSLIRPTGFAELTSFPEDSQANFYGLFKGCNIIDASDLLLPATAATDYCYHYMFNGCSNLSAAPKKISATSMAYSSCAGMFDGCTSLTSAPELPATSLSAYCYEGMFRGCTSLTIAPELPATGLASYCYIGMFNGCSNLRVTPVLPAQTLYEGCYQAMFRGCGLVNEIKCYAINNIEDHGSPVGTLYWVDGVAETGTFTKAASAVWPNFYDDAGIPSGWTVQNAS